MFNVSDQVREAIVNSTNSVQNIAKLSDVNHSDLIEFLQNGGEIESDEFDRLCKTLKLELVEK
jgi:hypothetical protein